MTILEIVDVFRLCCVCERWRPLAAFRCLSKVCRYCRWPNALYSADRRGAPYRTLALTDKGRAAARAA